MIEAHGYGMRYKLMIMSIHVAEVQVVKCFDHGDLCQLQNCDSFVTDKRSLQSKRFTT